MKKLIFLITLFLCTSNVYALNNQGKLYEEYWQQSGVNVFAKSQTGTMDYNGWMVKSTVDDKIYYCIEPEIYMQNSSDALVGTHKIYEGQNNIINNSRLDSNTYKKVNLLAYYGYGYKNHQDKKWYGITQTLIWQILRPDINWQFKTSRYGVPDNNLYLTEIKELELLINNHNKKPSFNNSKKTILLNETIILSDINNVLTNYEITTSNDNILLIKDQNNLKITAKKEGITNITMLKRSNVGSNFTLFSGGSLQDIITRGEVEDVLAKLEITVKNGELKLEKVDGDTKKPIPEGSASLFGAEYGIYNDANEQIATIIFDDSLTKTINLPYGNYFIKELVAPPGYNLNNKIYKIKLDNNHPSLNLILEDYVIKSIHKIYKEKGGSGESFQKESGAEFLITNDEGTIKKVLTTGDDGYAEVNLPYGKYLVTQIKGMPGYELVKPYTIYITKEDIIEKHLKNLKPSKIIFTKIDDTTNKPLPDTKIAIYSEDKNLLFEGITDQFGRIEIPSIPIGKYYYKEISPPPGYIIDSEVKTFEVLKNGEIINIKMTNQKFEMPDTFINYQDQLTIIITIILTISGLILTIISYVKKNHRS